MKRAAVVLAFLATLLVAGWAQARTIEILAAERLELRNITPPGGTQPEEYVIITGSPARVRVDGKDELEANRIEFNRTRRLLNVVGDGVYRTEQETVAGHDFNVDLATEGLSTEDVIIATREIDVVGDVAERIPGQIDVRSGYFSPCGRCGQTPNDYAFRAERLTIYPGDRLIAWNATLLLADQPVLFLPVVVLFLNDPSRQPRLDLQVGSAEDPNSGVTIEADLPFVTGAFGVGFTLLRYYSLQQPQFGGGVDYTAYNLFGFTNTTHVFFLGLPPKNDETGAPLNTGALFAYRLESTGAIPLTPGAPADEAWPDLSFGVKLSRADAGIAERELRGNTGPDHRTDYEGRVGLENARFSASLALNGFIDNRDTSTLTPAAARAGLPLVVQTHPDFTFVLRGPALTDATVGPVSLRAFGFKVGWITAPYDPLNPSARRTAESENSPYITAGRVEVTDEFGFSWNPWPDAILTASSAFTGRYYTTRNPADATEAPPFTGEFERNVQIRLSAGFEQRLFSSAVTLGVQYNYSLSEGESPFAFERVFTRPPTQSATGRVRVQPFPWLSLNASQTYYFSNPVRPTVRWDPAVFDLNVSPAPIVATVNFSVDLARLQPVFWRATLRNNVPNGVSFSVGSGYRYHYDPVPDDAVGLTPPQREGFDPFAFSVGYGSSDGRFRTTLSFTQDPNTGEVRSWTGTATLTTGDFYDPFTISVNETLVPPQYTPNPQNLALWEYSPLPPAQQPATTLTGSVNATYAGYQFTITNALNFRPWAPGDPFYPTTPPSTAEIVLRSAPANPTEAVSWSLSLRSNLDFDPFSPYRPVVSGTIRVPPSIEASLAYSIDDHRLDGNLNVNASPTVASSPLSLALAFNLFAPDAAVNRDRFELTGATLQLGLDVVPGVSAQGTLGYRRNEHASADGTAWVFEDNYTFNNFGVTLAFARDGQTRPEAYLSVLLNSTYTITSVNGEASLPTLAGQPAFTGWRPKIVLTVDRCCYALQLTFDAGTQGNPKFAFSFLLPAGGKKDIITADPTNGIRFPLSPLAVPVVDPDRPREGVTAP